MIYSIEIKKSAQKEIEFFKKSDKNSFEKITIFLLELKKHPKTGSGNPEQLKHQLNEYWSRRINQKDRLIYSIDDEKIIVHVVSTKGHYFDK